MRRLAISCTFLSIAQGSIVELETQVLIAARLRYIQSEQEEALLGATGEIGRMLRGLRKALRDKLTAGH
ncbi:MAG: four helix bundle protein [Planctomycetota bacterium]